MTLRRFDLERMKTWTLSSISYINKDNNWDALILGGFSGSIIEFLGRCLRIHQAANKDKLSQVWYEDFLDKYMKKYYSHRNILYKILRCEGAHATLAQSGIGLTCDENYQKFHLCGIHEATVNRKFLLIYSPEFVEDLRIAVEEFFSDVKKDNVLEENCQKTFREVFQEGEDIIDKEEKEGRFKVKVIAFEKN